MAVKSKSKPNPSYVSSSQAARFRVIRGELSPAELASSTSNDDLNKSIEGGIAQASVMWLLCRRSVVIQDCAEDLEEQIVQFSSAVFDAIGTSYPILRNSGQERLWLIYFKGLLTANTHSLEKMVPALRNIASKRDFGGLPPLSKGPREIAKPTPGRISDAEALEQIARGLEQKNNCF